MKSRTSCAEGSLVGRVAQVHVRDPNDRRSARVAFSALGHARRGGVGDEGAALVGDPAVAERDRPPRLDHLADRGQPSAPDRLEEVDLQLDGRERVTFREQGDAGAAHRAVGEVAEDPAVQRPGRARVLRPRVELEGDAALLRRDHPHADQVADWRRREPRRRRSAAAARASRQQHRADHVAALHRLERVAPALERRRCA